MHLAISLKKGKFHQSRGLNQCIYQDILLTSPTLIYQMSQQTKTLEEEY